MAETVIRRERRRRVRLLSAAGLALAAASTVFALGRGQIRFGADPGVSAPNCVATCSASNAVNQRAFSFDGTITRIGEQHDGSDPARSGTSPVTLTVNEWFRGGTAPTVTVDAPARGDADNSGLSYAVGRRLLVSGEPRWGGNDPLRDAVAWGCGFTRAYAARAAAEWRDVRAAN